MVWKTFASELLFDGGVDPVHEICHLNLMAKFVLLQQICGVSLHPKYGGWFALRGVLIFSDIQVPDLEQKLPVDILPDNEGRIRLLELFNYHWQDWSYRDVVPVQEKYSEEQKLYFGTLPKDRMHILEKLIGSESPTDIPSSIQDVGHANLH